MPGEEGADVAFSENHLSPDFTKPATAGCKVAVEAAKAHAAYRSGLLAGICYRRLRWLWYAVHGHHKTTFHAFT